jgi:hypothetical protein
MSHRDGGPSGSHRDEAAIRLRELNGPRKLLGIADHISFALLWNCALACAECSEPEALERRRNR